MPRAARALVDGEVYHVLNRGNGRSNVFHKPADFEAFVKLIGEAKERYPVKVIAYCLMSNHFHLLVKPTLGEDLSKWMRWLMTSHVRRYHRHHGTSGHIWQGRFKSFIVQDDEHLVTAARYVEGNPVQAKMVSSAREWHWSSHRENLGETERGLTDEGMFEVPADWAAYVDTPLSGRELNKLKLSLHRGVALGTGSVGACPHEITSC
ncbi:MAG: transposase [Desulfuromonas sp.]|uniref:REP-associated tyrosine transposase n=1 Tax=Desulfuromonas sp. TaxID=892 RepID=UPI000CBCF899|nr:transposase [Desulfuromonas sp.]PLX85521.1 MAG: transposase [Desulfuromonas sp.]